MCGFLVFFFFFEVYKVFLNICDYSTFKTIVHRNINALHSRFSKTVKVYQCLRTMAALREEAPNLATVLTTASLTDVTMGIRSSEFVTVDLLLLGFTETWLLSRLQSPHHPAAESFTPNGS
jgi:hypothetical protein